MRQQNMVPSYRQRGYFTSSIFRQKTKIKSWAPDGSPTLRQTDRLTVGRKLTSTFSQKSVVSHEVMNMEAVESTSVFHNRLLSNG
jgi:hypothetical protein